MSRYGARIRLEPESATETEITSGKELSLENFPQPTSSDPKAQASATKKGPHAGTTPENPSRAAGRPRLDFHATSFINPLRLVTLYLEEGAHAAAAVLLGAKKLKLRLHYRTNEGSLSAQVRRPAQAIGILLAGSAAQAGAIAGWVGGVILPNLMPLFSGSAPVLHRLAMLDPLPLLLGGMMVGAHAVRFRGARRDREEAGRLFRKSRAEGGIFRPAKTAAPVTAHSSWLVWMNEDGIEEEIASFDDLASIRKAPNGSFSGCTADRERKAAVLNDALDFLMERDELLRSLFNDNGSKGRWSLRIVKNIPAENGNFVLSRSSMDEDKKLHIELNESALDARRDEDIEGFSAIVASEIYHCYLEHMFKTEFRDGAVDDLTLEAFALLKQLEMLYSSGSLDEVREVLKRQDVRGGRHGASHASPVA